MKKQALFFIFFYLISNIFGQAYDYPFAPTSKVTDTLFGLYIIEDPFRGMEEPGIKLGKVSKDESPFTKLYSTWITDQNDFSKRKFSQITSVVNPMKTISSYRVQYLLRFKKRKYYYSIYSGNIRYSKQANSTEFILLGLRDLDPDLKNLPRVNNYEPSSDNKVLAVSYSKSRNSISELKFVNIKNSRIYKDHITDLMNESIGWHEDGLYYVKRLSADEGGGQVVRCHKLATDESEDITVFKRKNEALSLRVQTFENERYLIIEEWDQKKDIANYYFMDLKSDDPKVKPLVLRTPQLFFIEYLDEHFYVATGVESDNGSIVKIDPNAPLKWKQVLPSLDKGVLIETDVIDNNIYTIHLVDGAPVFSMFDFKGERIHSFGLPAGNSIFNISATDDADEISFSVSNYFLPPVFYKFNLKTLEKKVVNFPSASYSIEDYKMEEHTVISSDGTEVPMIVLYKEGLKMDGSAPTIISTYGGFGEVVTPRLDRGLVYWIEKGGVYAFIAVRGGGELGISWREAGQRHYKINSINDFIAGSEYLIEKGFSSSSTLAGTGLSNGGLIAASAAVKRPDLYRAIVPIGAPLDISRLENKSTLVSNIDEYGSSAIQEDFEAMQSYSPYLNLKPDVNYPSMLIVTTERNTDVPPAQSYKFAAKLQKGKNQDNIVLLKTIPSFGGEIPRGYYSLMKDQSDLYAFVWWCIKKQK